jgi:hypothetical protein
VRERESMKIDRKRKREKVERDGRLIESERERGRERERRVSV